MTDKTLQEVKEVLEEISEGDYRYIEGYQMFLDVKQALASLNSYIEARESEEMVERVAKAIKHETQKQHLFKYNHPDNADWIGGKDGIMTLSVLAKAAIKAMEGGE